MFQSTFHAVACHLEILGWKQVYFTVWHLRKFQRLWNKLRPVVKPALFDAMLYFSVGSVLGIVAAGLGAIFLPAGLI